MVIFMNIGEKRLDSFQIAFKKFAHGREWGKGKDKILPQLNQLDGKLIFWIQKRRLVHIEFIQSFKGMKHGKVIFIGRGQYGVGKAGVMGDGMDMVGFHYTALKKTKHFFRDQIAVVGAGLTSIYKMDGIMVDK